MEVLACKCFSLEIDHGCAIHTILIIGPSVGFISSGPVWWNSPAAARQFATDGCGWPGRRMMMVKGLVWCLSNSQPGSDSCGGLHLLILACCYRVFLCQESHPILTHGELECDGRHGGDGVRFAWFDVHIGPMNGDGKGTTVTHELTWNWTNALTIWSSKYIMKPPRPQPRRTKRWMTRCAISKISPGTATV